MRLWIFYPRLPRRWTGAIFVCSPLLWVLRSQGPGAIDLSPPWVVSGPHWKAFVLGPGRGYTKLLVICLWCSKRSSISALYASPVREKRVKLWVTEEGWRWSKKEEEAFLSPPAWHPYMYALWPSYLHRHLMTLFIKSDSAMSIEGLTSTCKNTQPYSSSVDNKHRFNITAAHVSDLLTCSCVLHHRDKLSLGNRENLSLCCSRFNRILYLQLAGHMVKQGVSLLSPHSEKAISIKTSWM